LILQGKNPHIVFPGSPLPFEKEETVLTCGNVGVTVLKGGRKNKVYSYAVLEKSGTQERGSSESRSREFIYRATQKRLGKKQSFDCVKEEDADAS